MANCEVFLDTSGLDALIVRAARRLVVTDYVLAETVSLANARSGTRVATRVLDLIEQSAAIRIEWIGMSRFDLTKAFFRKHSDHDYSFTDCTSFILMRELSLSLALTTDRHFSEAGFESLLPTSR